MSGTMLLYQRQKLLLALLQAIGGKARKVDFQKLLFLFNQELGPAALYEFVPYKFGPFSFTSYADRRKLAERGLLNDRETAWVLSADGRRAAHGVQIFRKELASFARRYAALRGDRLIARTYRRFPYFATRSEIAAQVLRGDPRALGRIAQAAPKPQRAALLTIGYEGRTVEGYLNALLKNRVTVLCDVRRNPISRKYGFSKEALRTSCSGLEIRYEHLPELGIASDRRQSLETQADYDALFTAYRREDLPKVTPTLRRIRGWVAAGDRVALTCFEQSPKRCHRHCVAEAVEMESGKEFATIHI